MKHTDDIEARLKQRRLAAPSPELDRRMEKLFAAPPPARRGWFAHPVALWQCAAACVLCALCGYWFHGSRAQRGHEPPTTTTVYVVQPGPSLPADVFDATARPERFFDRPGEVRVTYPVQENGENHV